MGSMIMKTLKILLAFAFSTTIIYACNSPDQSTFKQKVSHDYQVSKNETVKVAQKTGSAVKSGYEKSKGWASKEWAKHENKTNNKQASAN